MAVGNIKIRQATMVAIRRDRQDQFVLGSNGNVTSTSFVDTDATITFTPETAGDYLVIAQCVLGKDTTATAVKAQLLVGATPYTIGPLRVTNTDDRRPWCSVVKLNLAASSQTVKIQVAVATAGTGNYDRPTILALRLDRFQRTDYAEDRSQTNTSDTTADYSGATQTKTTLTNTPTSGPYQTAIICAGRIGGVAGANVGWAQSVQDATTIGENRFTPLGAIAADSMTFLHLNGASLASNSTAWKTQRKSDSGGSVGIADSAVAFLQLGGCSVEIPGSTNILGLTNIL